MALNSIWKNITEILWLRNGLRECVSGDHLHYGLLCGLQGNLCSDFCTFFSDPDVHWAVSHTIFLPHQGVLPFQQHISPEASPCWQRGPIMTLEGPLDPARIRVLAWGSLASPHRAALQEHRHTAQYF